MPDTSDFRFSCAGCGKTYAWKPELAGKRAKCKCGSLMTVPDGPPAAPAAPEPDDLYDLAPTDEPPKPVARPKIAPTVAPKGSVSGAVAAAKPAPVLGYQGGRPSQQKDRFSTEVLMDMKRDVHVPVALLLTGFLLYVGYFAWRYHLNATGIVFATTGISILIAFKAALLIGFALVVAGPLGVSFGGLWTAVLKLAAIAVFSDGLATWVDAGVAKMAGSGGFAGMISFPIVLACYWGLLIYLFSMDPGDSWTVVALLSIFDFIVRWALLLIFLNTIMSWSGVAIPGSGAKTSRVSGLTQNIEDMKENRGLAEVRAWKADGHVTIMDKEAEAWYAAGAKNVYYTIGRDLTGKPEIGDIVVELPDEKDQRAKCYQIYKDALLERHDTVAPSDYADTGEPYIEMDYRSSKR